MKISVVILTKNEEKNIAECIASVRFADEILVIDDHSTDKTREISKKLGARVFVKEMNMDYSGQSNFGMQRANGEWVFFLDADERIKKALRNEVLRAIKESDVNGFYLKRIDYMWGRWLKHGEIGEYRALRLVRNGSGKWVRRVHPKFQIAGTTKNLNAPLRHYPHPSLKKFIRSVNKWSTWDAVAKREEGKKGSLVKVFLWPLAKFLRNFFFKTGFSDGMHGFVFAIVMSFSSFLSWSKLWIRQG